MKMDCDIIRDLLPLYTDGACSENSRKMVEEHLNECSDCRSMLEKLKETELENDLVIEKNEVIRYGERRFKRRSAAVGSVISGIFMIPILICLIVNIRSGLTLGPFFVMLSAMAVAASLTIVPLMVPEDRAFWTFCAFCASLVTLLGVACLYTRGNWFWVASSAVLFGLGVVFLPFVIRAKPVRRVIGNGNRLLIVLGLDAALFINMINMISARGRITVSSILFTLAVIAGIVLVFTEITRKRGKEE